MQDNDNEVTTTTEAHHKSKETQFNKKKVKVITLGCIVLLVCLLVVGVLTKRIAIAFMPNSSARVVSEVCGTSDIDNFNTNFTNEDFNKTIEAIEKRAGYNNDANCVYMQYRYYYDRLQYTKARDRATRVEELINAGNFIDSRFAGLQNLAMIQQSIDAIKDISDGKSVDE